VEAAKLVRMANQIAANFDYGPDQAKAVAGVVDHMRRFWSPMMLEELVEHQAKGDGGLTAVAQMAVTQIAQERRAAR